MRLFLPLLLVVPFTARADVPRVVTDIAPIHSLVAQVMDGVASPDVLVSGGASPHDFQFTFTQAETVQDADLVIWAGEGLTPWLEEALDTLAPDVARVTLLETQGWPKLDLRDWDDDHDHDHGHGHDHGDNVDPHAWLSPVTATAWTAAIANKLVEIDPANETLYRANAQATTDRLAQLDTDLKAQLSSLPRSPYLVPHDAYQYFANQYGLPAAGTITLNDAQSPSPTTIAALQATVRDQGVTCVLSDPQSRDAWVDLVRDGSTARTALADPMGTAFDTGPDHYDQMMRALADAYVACLGA